MTGSPVFHDSLKKQKIRRIKTTLNFDEENANIGTNETKPCVDQNDRKPSQSICSNSSSFVFPNKRGVKRKLNFDVDCTSDDVSSLRFSGKNLSLYGFQSKHSSITDNRSLPDFNTILSPNKKRSYSRSSVTSSVNCRRRLFSDDIESGKKQGSPVLCRKLLSKNKEIKLSLKKKFPGVPNSDSARSGLLLNLAFSKYNLSNNKKEAISVDFVDNEIVKTASKKDFVHYSQIKKDDSSLCHSPVFMAIKKVKRKLNLEDQDGSSSTALQTEQSKDLDSMHLECIAVEKPASSNLDRLNNAKQCVTKNDRYSPHKDCSEQISSPFFSNKKLKSCKNDLFMNSKIRSTLRNKIFDLSKITKSDQRLQPNGSKMTSTVDATKSPEIQKTEVKKKVKKWINRDLFSVKDCQKNMKTVSEHNQFLKSHMRRFLEDCRIAVEKRSKNHETQKPEEISKENAETEKIVQTCDPIIENIDSQNEFIIENTTQENSDPVVIDEEETDESALLTASLKCEMFVMVKDVLGQKSKEGNGNASTKKVLLPSSKQESTNSMHVENSVLPEEILFDSVPETQFLENNTKVDQFSSNASYSCVQFTNPKSPLDTENQVQSSQLLETAQKNKRKKYSTNSLMYRLDKLLSREKTDFRIWEYEINKKRDSLDRNSNPAVFCVEKMWKEYSYLILLCSHHRQNSRNDSTCSNEDILPFTVNICNSVVVIIEQEYCPKNLSYSSIFQVHPPWRLMNFAKNDPVVMLKPRKISLISKDASQILYKDPTLPKIFVTVKENVLCDCGNIPCDCAVPNSYQCFVSPLLFSQHDSFSSKNYQSLNCYDIDSFSKSRINDVIIKYKLFPNQNLRLELKILHVYKKLSYWYVICADELLSTCCILIEGEANTIPCGASEETTIGFDDVIPWKLIPQK